MNQNYSKATTILLKDLEEARTSENAARSFLDMVDIIIANAKKELYNDFLSTHSTPQILLHTHLTDAGLTDLAKNVLEGKYDD